ncbi:MAG: hypothetical protein ACLPYY_03345 [Acidimicrobiales bacterium]
MKLNRFRLLLAGFLGVAAVLVPVSVPFAENLFGGGAASPSTLASPDVITYAQASSGTSVTYTPGDGSAATTQTLTPSGRCGTPTVTPPATPILGMSGALYSSGYSGSPSPVPVGSYRAHTGVCALPVSWQIENLPPFGEEGLDFTVLGSNSLIGSERIFSDAKISLQNEDVWPLPSSVPVQLVEMLGGTQVGTVTCTIGGPAGTTLTVDTNNTTAAGCTGTTPLTGFDTVEVEVPQAYTAASVVGTSTFTLAPQVCGGGSITSSGTVQATLSIASTGGCESYTAFSSNAAGTSLTYNEYSGGTPQPFTVTIPWAPQPDCQPSPDVAAQYTGTSLPLCLVTQFTVNGTTYYDQSFCAEATTALPLCTQNKDYNYTADPGETQITEIWSGYIDWNVRL